MHSPDDVENRNFLVSVRGYDRGEVDEFLAEVAEDLRRANRRISELEEQAATGSDGPDETSQQFAELGDETQRILEAAREAGSEITRRAKRQADRELQSARGEAARVVAEGERRREAAEAVVARLEEFRDNLSDQLRSVRGTAEEALREIVPPEGAPSLRETAAHAADELSPSNGTGVDGEASDQEAELGSEEPDSEEPGSEELGEGGTDGGRGEPSGGQSVGPATGGAASLFDTGGDEDDAEHPGAASEVLAGMRTTGLGADTPPTEGDGPVNGSALRPVLRAVPGEETEPATSAAGVATSAGDGPAAGVAVAAPAGSAPTEAPSPVTEEAPAASATDAAADLSPPVAGVATPERDRALSALEPELVRRTKRGLAELENIALVRLRTSKGQISADRTLVEDAESTALAPVARRTLQTAYDAGVKAAGGTGRHDLPAAVGDDGEGRELDEDFAVDGGGRVRSPLEASLRMGLDAGEGVDRLRDRVEAVFSELKSHTAEELAGTHLMRAYELGMLDVWAVDGVAARTWVRGDEDTCPEARCRSNEEAGAVIIGDAFPTGHEVPPVHTGCTCTTEAASD